MNKRFLSLLAISAFAADKEVAQENVGVKVFAFGAGVSDEAKIRLKSESKQVSGRGAAAGLMVEAGYKKSDWEVGFAGGAFYNFARPCREDVGYLDPVTAKELREELKGLGDLLKLNENGKAALTGNNKIAYELAHGKLDHQALFLISSALGVASFFPDIIKDVPSRVIAALDSCVTAAADGAAADGAAAVADDDDDNMIETAKFVREVAIPFLKKAAGVDTHIRAKSGMVYLVGPYVKKDLGNNMAVSFTLAGTFRQVTLEVYRNDKVIGSAVELPLSIGVMPMVKMEYSLGDRFSVFAAVGRSFATTGQLNDIKDAEAARDFVGSGAGDFTLVSGGVAISVM